MFMNKISLYKKIKFFLFYRKRINEIRSELKTLHNVRVDNAYRLYTVHTLPKEYISEYFDENKTNLILDRIIRDHTAKLNEFLQLGELCCFYTSTKIDNYSYLLVFGYSLFLSNVFLTKFYTIFAFVILIAIITIFKLFI